MPVPTPNPDLQRRVLRALHSDGRASFARIATALGISRRAVAGIVQAALADDELRLAVSISPDLLGLKRFAYVQLAVDGAVEPVRAALVAMAETTFVADVAGAFPIDVELRVGPDPELRGTLDRITQIPGVRELRTHQYERIEMNRYSPLRTGRTTLSIDDTDRALIRRLQAEPRASFRELGEATGLSPSGARLRFESLVRHRAIKVVGIPVRGAHVETPSLGLGIRARGAIDTLIPQIRALDPEFLAVTVGGYDFIATLSADTPEELLAVTDELRQIPQITAIDTWANLRILKEQYGQSDLL